jgi:hypothetical protein
MKQPPLPDQETWNSICAVLQEYWHARYEYIQAESIAQKYIQSIANELRNGLDDTARAMFCPQLPNNMTAHLDDARRHFRRARSEATEATLSFYLNKVQQILTSLYAEPAKRVVRAAHYDALDEVYKRGLIVLVNARREKTDHPNRDRAERCSSPLSA